MKKETIDLFFKRLDGKLGFPTDIILLGASAGSLMGHIRPSLDIDFEIRAKGRVGSAKKELIQKSALATSLEVGVAVNFSDNVSHWSMIDFLDYRKTAIPYKKIGQLTIKLIAPEYWTIGKMTRFLELDIQDMIKIIRLKKIPPARLTLLWASALKASGLSLDLGTFRQHVEYFLTNCGPKLWGKKFDADKAIQKFRKQAKISL